MTGGDAPAHVLHVGAGSGRELPRYLAAGTSLVLLVEADPEIAARLRRLAAPHERVRVLEGAVSADPRRRPFRRTSLPGLNGFRAPLPAMAEAFPRLRTLAEVPVTPLSPDRVAAEMDLDPDAGPGLLVIEAPGEALGILTALREAGLLERFGAIRLREALEPLHEGAPPAEAIRAFLAGAGYAATFETDPEEPARPWLEARLDLAARRREEEIARLMQALVEAHARAEALAAERDAARRQVETLAAERDAARQQAEFLTAERNTARQQAGNLAAEHDALKAAHEEARQQVEMLHKRDRLTAMAREEALRAEAQIDLIRDLLLGGVRL